MATDLKAVYCAPTAEAAQLELTRFGEKWDKPYGPIRLMRQRHWEHIIPFFAFPPEVRKVIYTTNAVESLNMSLRKIIKTRGSFPREQAALKLMYLALKNVVAKWQRQTVPNWKAALNRFAVLWEARDPEVPGGRAAFGVTMLAATQVAPCPRKGTIPPALPRSSINLFFP